MSKFLCYDERYMCMSPKHDVFPSYLFTVFHSHLKHSVISSISLSRSTQRSHLFWLPTHAKSSQFPFLLQTNMDSLIIHPR